MNKPALFVVAAIAAFAATPSLADAPVFAAPFTSHAVLQRDCALPVWGTAQPGAIVTVALDGQRLSATADRESDETVSVAVPEGFAPVKVRFAWDDYPVCNLVNGEGLPCGPFELEIH